jgi:hypothetical protein
MFISNHLPRLDLAQLAVAIVTVLASKVDEKPWDFIDDSGKKREGTTRSQKAKLEVAGFAYPYKVRLEDGQPPYAAGEYVLDLAAMVQVNKEAVNLSKFPVLLPMKAAAAAKA